MILRITTSTLGGVVTVTVAGELDISNVDQLERALATDPGRPLVVDLTGVEYLGSAAVKVLFNHVDRTSELVIRNDDTIARVLRIAGLADIVRIRTVD